MDPRLANLSLDVRQALGQLAHHRLRTALTLLGMVFGVGAVIAMLAVSEGGKRQALELIEGMGLRNLIVEARELDSQSLKEVRKYSAGLSIRDAESIDATLPFVEGWAVYAEQVMIEAGYQNHDPLQKLITLKWYLRAVTNAIIDSAIHVDGMTRDEAMKLMIEGGFQEEREAAARRAAERPLRVARRKATKVRQTMAAAIGAKVFGPRPIAVPTARQSATPPSRKSQSQPGRANVT